MVKFLTDITARKRAEERQNLLMAELDHRVKNVLANVAAIARLSSARATSVSGFVKALEGRIQAMSSAHALLRKGNWDSASVAELVRAALVPFHSVAAANIEAGGDPIRVHPPVAQSLALVLNELAANAVKHGALAAPGGRVSISWSRVPDSDAGQFRFVWREIGGPRVSKPERKGFGITVLESVASEGVSVDCLFDEDGFVYSLEGPLAAPDRPSRDAPNGNSTETATRTAHAKALPRR